MLHLWTPSGAVPYLIPLILQGSNVQLPKRVAEIVKQGRLDKNICLPFASYSLHLHRDGEGAVPCLHTLFDSFCIASFQSLTRPTRANIAVGKLTSCPKIRHRCRIQRSIQLAPRIHHARFDHPDTKASITPQASNLIICGFPSRTARGILCEHRPGRLHECAKGSLLLRRGTTRVSAENHGQIGPMKGPQCWVIFWLEVGDSGVVVVAPGWGS